jgi:phosphate transport system ATP-binding protein
MSETLTAKPPVDVTADIALDNVLGAMADAIVASAADSADDPATNPATLFTRDLTVTYGSKEALHPTSLDFAEGTCTALIGPSGCGKSTFLRCLNLMNREIPKCRIGGEVWFNGRDINHGRLDLFGLRQDIGMVFQQPTPFRKSIRENVLFAPKHHGVSDTSTLNALLEMSLRGAGLWDEVKDKLGQSALALSGGQQQRLCIARTLAVHPKVVLLDEPCSALDPISTAAVENTIRSMVDTGICVIIVTHNMEQAMRVSDNCAFFYLGDMVEWGTTDQIFNAPRTKRLGDYLAGRFS